MYDLIIKNARLADGLGTPLTTTDVAIQAGRIAKISHDIADRATETIDAKGLVLAPGMVDVHTHYDAQLTWDRTASPSPSLGVTTVVMGNCGFGIAPAPPPRRQTIARNLSEVEGMSLAALEQGIDWDFESFADYLALLKRKGSFPNVATFVGHSTVRSVVMGEAASQRTATGAEVAAMQDLVRAAMAAGAIGFASSQSQNHNGYGGVPMPSRLADETEMRALVGVLGEFKKGIFQITVGPNTGVDFLESLAEETGRPIIFSALFHNDAFPERAPTMLAQCAAAQARGNLVYAQVSCQPLSMDFTLANAYPLQSLDVWKPLVAAQPDALKTAISDASFRQKFEQQLAQPAKGRLFYGDWQQVEITQVMNADNRHLEGASIADVAAKQGVKPLDLFFDLALAEDLQTVYSAKLLNADEEQVEPLLKHDASLISLSDAGAHLAFLCDAGYGLKLLGHWVRERGTFSLEEAIRQLTSVPANTYGIKDRGRVVPGAYADMMLFDPEQVDVSGLERVNDLPGGESRLIRHSQGLQGVWVNGVRVWDGHDYCQPETAPGQILDRF